MKNSRIKKIILHIGLNKTATTSIQESLFFAKEVLLHEGFYYPVFVDSGIQHFDHNDWLVKYCKTISSNLNEHRKVKNQPENRISENYKLLRERLITQLQQFPDKKLIVSSEGLLALNTLEINYLKDLLEGLTNFETNFEIIVFVRHPVFHAQSVLQQGVKMGFDTIKRKTNIEIQSSGTRTSKILDKFIQVFGKSTLRVYRFEDAIQHPFGPAGMFLSVIGFPEKILPLIKQNKSNKSLSSEAVKILSVVNEKFPLCNGGKTNTHRDNESVKKISQLPGQKFSFSIDDQKRIWDNSEEDRNWLIENFHLPPYEFSVEDLPSKTKLWSIETLKHLELLVPELPDEFKSIVAQVLESEVLAKDGTISRDSKKLMKRQISIIRASLPRPIEKPLRKLSLINRKNFEKYFKAELSNQQVSIKSEGKLEIHPSKFPYVLELPKVMQSFESKTIIKLIIISSGNSTLTIEYQTHTMSDYKASFAVQQKVKKGKNTIEFVISDFDFVGKTRLVFRDSEVNFKIQRIEFMTDAPSYEELFKENEHLKTQIEGLEQTRLKRKLSNKSAELISMLNSLKILRLVKFFRKKIN